MNQFNKSFLKIVSIAITLCLVTACSNDYDLDNLNETIFVRHKNADMPAYIKGNASEKVFLITLHGGPGGLGFDFLGTAFSDIEHKYGVVYFDQRGSGNSQGHYSKNELNIDIMAEDVLALVKVIRHKFGIDSRFFLLGASWGGTLGTATLLKNQSDFKGWIEVGGANNPAGLYNLNKEALTTTANNQIALGNSIDFWESALALVAQVDPIPNVQDGDLLNFKGFEAEIKLVEDGFIDSVENGIEDNNSFLVYNRLTRYWNLNQVEDILIYNNGQFTTLDFTSQLSKITIPALFISGQYDLRVPIASAQNAYEIIGSEIKSFKIFERSGHSPNFSEPERFAAEVLNFISTHK
ncbi:alpha/beta fold hydrolase [Aquimarina sp. 2201CG1-2-11]|uniref:alpha/beta fold hydrolase n=1 Tax=Aquimarina discodermiae TaxID=3231043 RepID=UPI003462B94A